MLLTRQLACQLLLALAPLQAADGPYERVAIIITGLGGMPEYDENFVSWASSLKEIFEADTECHVYGLDGRQVRRERILEVFEQAGTSLSEHGELWLLLIGHGSYDGREYKFNIVGPDLSGRDLKAFLDLLQGRKTYLIAATSSSGVLAETAPGPGRVILTATRSGRERQPPLFMSFFIEGAQTAAADSNKDGKVSLLEVFSFTESKVADWYSEKGRIQTEHPQLNDSEGKDVLAASAFLSEPPEQAYRSLQARQLAQQRLQLEREIEALKLQKSELSTVQYYQQLEQLLVQVASLTERIAELEGPQ